MPRIAGVVVLLAVAAFAALMLNGFVVQPYSVPGNAMTPTFRAGDRILVARPGVVANSVRTGEIVVFRPRHDLPCSVVGGRGGNLVRRVVALPGDTIWSVGNTIFVDGRPLRDAGWYDDRFGQLGSTPIVSTTLGRGQYYVMADNRSDACDSRAFGPISKSSIVGAGIAIVARSGHVFFRTL
jgi:signal peptidase I